MLLWARTMAAGSLARTIALLTVRRGIRLGGWEVMLLFVIVASAIAYLVAASRIDEIAYNDGAYYYGVARHMASTGRYEEPIVWHFLQPPSRVPHTPFDYWGGLTSLLLVPPLAIFGATPHTAFASMAVISAAALGIFWYLVCCALPLRHQAAQLLALVLFALSPAMDVYRFQPESTSVAQVFLLASLVALCRRRFGLSVLLAFGIFLARTDGLVLFAVLTQAALVLHGYSHNGWSRYSWHPAMVALACLSSYALWSWVSFGRPIPPGPGILPGLGVYWRVFDWLPAHPDRMSGWSTALSADYIVKRLTFGLRALRSVPFTPAMDWWIVLACVPILGLRWAQTRSASAIWLVGVVAFFGLVIVSGPAYYAFRAPHTFTPMVVLAGAIGIDLILAGLGVVLQRAGDSRWIALFIGAAVFAGSFALLAPLPFLQSTKAQPNLPDQGTLTALDPVLQGDTVATNVPWYVIAYTRSPAVSVPFNGGAALAAVLDRYDARWLVLFGNPPYWVSGATRTVLQAVLSGAQTQFGGFRLERVPVDIPASVYRIHRPGRDQPESPW
jgi:hypothetical protein